MIRKGRGIANVFYPTGFNGGGDPDLVSLRIKVDQYFSQHHIKPNITFENAAQDTTLQLCRDNPVLGILTNTAYYHYSGISQFQSGGLLAFPIQEALTTFQLYLVYRKNPAIPQYLQDFIDIASTTFQQHSITMQESLQHAGICE